MGLTTGIQFADSTVNGMMGCDGCELWPPSPAERAAHPEKRICYAGVATENMLSNGPRKGWPVSFDAPVLFPGRIEATARWKDLTGTTRQDKPWLDDLPRIIFCDDMGDRWTASLPIDSLGPTLPIIAKAPHIYLFLTKRPDRAAEFSRTYRLPENLWLGTTITSGQDARLRAIERADAARRWVSYEPILADAGNVVRRHPSIHWWVFGGSSGASAVPTDLQIIRDGVAACRDVGAAPFVKQLGAHVVCKNDEWDGTPQANRWGDGPLLIDRKGGAIKEWPEDLKVREFPQ